MTALPKPATTDDLANGNDFWRSLAIVCITLLVGGLVVWMFLFNKIDKVLEEARTYTDQSIAKHIDAPKHDGAPSREEFELLIRTMNSRLEAIESKQDRVMELLLQHLNQHNANPSSMTMSE